MTQPHFPFGYGNSSEQIVNILESTDMHLEQNFCLIPPDSSTTQKSSTEYILSD